MSVTNSQVVDPGSNVTLACNVSGASNTTTVVWNGPNGQLNENVTFYEENTIFVSNLVLNSLGSEDSGTYTCNVTDSDLSNSTVIIITPTITPLEPKSNVGDNSPVFMCDVQSSLSSTTRWFMYDLGGNVQEVFDSDSDNTILSWNENVTFQDAGMYQFAVSTLELGEVRSQNATLTGIHMTTCIISNASFFQLQIASFGIIIILLTKCTQRVSMRMQFCMLGTQFTV